MKIVLYSKSNFIADELKKESILFKELLILTEFEKLKEVCASDAHTIVLHHLDDFPLENESLTDLLKRNKHLHLIALANTPNNLQGCRLLQMGYKSYLHAVSNSGILKSAIKSVAKNNIYVYPQLMQFLVTQIPTSLQKNKNLDTLTPKELDVLQLVSKGYSNAKIANELDIAEVTVKKHIGSMFEKLEVKDRLSLALILK